MIKINLMAFVIVMDKSFLMTIKLVINMMEMINSFKQELYLIVLNSFFDFVVFN